MTIAFDAVALEYDFMATTFHDPSVFLQYLPSQRQRVLDVGCGSGLLAVALSNQFEQVVALDLSATLLAIAKAKRPNTNVLYCQMDADQLGLVGGFDYIVSQNVFHHFEDISRVLEQLKPLVQPGGRIVITDVTSHTETPPTLVYLVGAGIEYPANVRRRGIRAANRVFRFRVSRHWLAHLAQDKYFSPTQFEARYAQQLPNATFPAAGVMVWDKPTA